MLAETEHQILHSQLLSVRVLGPWLRTPEERLFSSLTLLP